MPDIEFACPDCEQTLEAPAEMAGETVECPNCAQRLVVPSLEAETPPARPPGASTPPGSVAAALAGALAREDAADEEKTDDGEADTACPECGAAMADGAVLCVTCGFHTRLGRRLETDLS